MLPLTLPSRATVADSASQTQAGNSWTSTLGFTDGTSLSRLATPSNNGVEQTSKHLEAAYAIRSTSALGVRISIDYTTGALDGLGYTLLEVAAVVGGVAGTFVTLPVSNVRRVWSFGGVGAWFGASDRLAFAANPVLAFRVRSLHPSLGVFRCDVHGGCRVELLEPVGRRGRLR